MATLTFPTLTGYNGQGPIWDPDSVNEQAVDDPAIRAKAEGGYTKTRPRYTRVPYKYTGAYIMATYTDKEAVKTFEKSVSVGARIFNWTEPKSKTVKQVRFGERCQYTCLNQSLDLWKIAVVFEEA